MSSIERLIDECDCNPSYRHKEARAELAELRKDRERLGELKRQMMLPYDGRHITVQYNCREWRVVESIPCSSCARKISSHGDDFNAAIDAAMQLPGGNDECN